MTKRRRNNNATNVNELVNQLKKLRIRSPSSRERLLSSALNELTERLSRVSIRSPRRSRPRMTENQARAFYRFASRRPYVRRAFRSMMSGPGRSVATSTSNGGRHATWHNLPSRIQLSQNAQRHYSPTRINQGMFNPNQFSVIYAVANQNRKRRYNNAVQRLVNRYKLPGNQYEGNTPAKYRTLYGHVEGVERFKRAFRNWQIASTRQEKSAKFSNMLRSLERLKVIQSHDILRINDNIANYYNSLLSNDIKRIIPLNRIRINRQTGAWNKEQLIRILRSIHQIQRQRMSS